MIYPDEILPKKPLAEAVFEFRWRHRDVAPEQVIQPQNPGLNIEAAMLVDPNYDLLVGALHVALKANLPFYERLPAAALPAQFATHVVQHRWRAGRDAWPALQLGPGVLTINMTEDYTWETFRAEVARGVSALLGAHPNAEAILTELLMLRYINGLDFDYQHRAVDAFLANELHVGITLDARDVMAGLPVEPTASEFDLRVTYPTTAPTGELSVRVVKGTRGQAQAIVWESQIVSRRDPPSGHQIEDWLEPAHTLMHNWFFRTTEGSLVESFR